MVLCYKKEESMKKPQYELAPLRAAVLQCRTNIVAFQQGITKEENRIDELQGFIRQWEEYNDNTSKSNS